MKQHLGRTALSIEQLKKRPMWNITTTDILKHGDQNRFGIYVARRCANLTLLSRNTHYNVSQDIKYICEKKENNILYNKLLSFCCNNRKLLRPHRDFIRLASKTEVEIQPICETGSINRMIADSYISGLNFNNSFGFCFQNGTIIYESYFFENKKIIDNDLYVFEDEIIRYENDLSIFKGNTHKPEPKPKQIREHALYALIEEIYVGSKCRRPKTIWNNLKNMAMTSHELVQEVSNWSSYDATINWISPNKNEQSMKRISFQNYIYKLNKKYSTANSTTSTLCD